MALFVHMTDADNKSTIIKNGVKATRIHYEDVDRGVFCMPVISDFYATHQWLREIKRFNSGHAIIAVYFKIPDDELVFCGKYVAAREKVRARKSHEIFMALEDKMGFQVIVERKIQKSELHKIKALPQIIGWRYFPQSHERKRCLCPACLRAGTYQASVVKEQELKKLFKALRHAEDTAAICDIFDKINELNIAGVTGTREEKQIAHYLQSGNDELACAAIPVASVLYRGAYRNYFFETLYKGESAEKVEACLYALLRIYGNKIVQEIQMNRCNEMAASIINDYMNDDE